MSQVSITESKWTTRRKVLTGISILAGVSFAFAMSWVSWELHDLNQTIRRFGEALSSKQYERAYGMTSKEFRAATNYKTFLKAHDGLSVRLGDLKGVDVIASQAKEQDDVWNGTAETNMNFSRGSLTVNFVLRKEGGLWRINSYLEQ